ncbi:MerR family transcriptional regulator [Pseudooceanicola aestuarii]|uniref:MerR family transcriptional regulator n=1 Tax=Pseudooceanicola aestuarii TaxID=2697319 RepID=UPI0013D1019D|nr:MerR family transcriptional regulator [Pseudooceanicola aestuarii]
MTKSADAFRTISEVADWLDTPAHVLRFWESKFSQVKPVKRAGGRRYYRPADMVLLGGIKRLLHDEGLTIKGVQKILRDKGAAHVSSLSQPVDLPQPEYREAEIVELRPVQSPPLPPAQPAAERETLVPPQAPATPAPSAPEAEDGPPASSATPGGTAPNGTFPPAPTLPAPLPPATSAPETQHSVTTHWEETPAAGGPTHTPRTEPPQDTPPTPISPRDVPVTAPHRSAREADAPRQPAQPAALGPEDSPAAAGPTVLAQLLLRPTALPRQQQQRAQDLADRLVALHG